MIITSNFIFSYIKKDTCICFKIVPTIVVENTEIKQKISYLLKTIFSLVGVRQKYFEMKFQN